MKSNLPFYFCCLFCLRYHPRNLLNNIVKCCKVLPYIFFSEFIILGLMYLCHGSILNNFYISCYVMVQLNWISIWYLTFPALYVKKIFSPLHDLGALAKNNLTTHVRAYFWNLYSTPFVYISVFVSVLHCLDQSLKDCIEGLFWNQAVWVFQICFFSGLFWLYEDTWDSIWNFEWVFLFLPKIVIQILIAMGSNL